MAITLSDIEAIIARFEASDWRRIELIAEGIELRLAKDGADPHPVGLDAIRVPIPAASTAALAPAAAVMPPPAPAPAPALTGHSVAAPSLGTFYRSPRPGEPPFAEIGQHVAAGTALCIIEVMKLMTIVNAPIAGRVLAFHVRDGELVEFDQPLVSIEPDA